MRNGALATAALLGVAAAAATAQDAQAQQIECGGVYAVQRGDTLATIAVRAYGVGEFQLIYLANADVIGPDPNVIEVGTPLRIPCLGELATPQDAPAEAAVTPAPLDPARAPAGVADPAPALAAGPAPRFIGVEAAAPFSGEALPGGGIFPELLRLAMQGAPGGAPQIDFAADWTAQLGALLPGGGYDVGFPWVRPDCETPAALGAESRARCRSFVFSDPFLEVVLGFWTMNGSDYAGAETHAGFEGARICRPEGMFVGDLETEGLVEPAVSLVAPATSEDCFRALLYGEVDVVSTDAAGAEEALDAIPGASRRVSEVEGLASLHTLHAVAPRGSRSGLEAIERLNAGLARMRRSGEWFSAVERSRAAIASGG